MHPIKTLTRPVRRIARAAWMPFQALFVVGVAAAVNAMTYHGTWWFKWVALGMGIATLVALLRGAKALLLLALVAGAGWWIWRRHGAAARERFDDWVRQAQPAAAEVLGRIGRA